MTFDTSPNEAVACDVDYDEIYGDSILVAVARVIRVVVAGATLYLCTHYPSH